MDNIELNTKATTRLEFDPNTQKFIAWNSIGEIVEIMEKDEFVRYNNGFNFMDYKNSFFVYSGEWETAKKKLGIFLYEYEIVKTDGLTFDLFPHNPSRIECNCGKDHGEFLKIEHDGEIFYICSDCINSVSICADCGKPIFDEDAQYETTDGEIICQECTENGSWTYCEKCGKWHSSDNSVEVHFQTRGRTVSEYWCDSCADDYAIKCDDCGKYWDNNRSDYLSDDSYTICPECAENWYTCENCSCLVHSDNIVCTDSGCYCESCAPSEDEDEDEDDRSHLINAHWSKFKPIFHGEGPLYFGMELEIDNGNNRNGCAEKIANAIDRDDLYMESDGSLGSNGIEIVFHPRTFTEWQNFKGSLETISTIAREFDYKSHDTTTCGLHIHASRNGIQSEEFPDIEENIGKIILYYETHFDDFLIFSRRTESALASWARRYDIDKEDSGKEIHRKGKNVNDRYRAINLQPSNTVEFRFFRGSLQVETILSALELVYILCTLSSTLDKENLLSLSFDNLIESGSETLRNYWTGAKQRKGRS